KRNGCDFFKPWFKKHKMRMLACRNNHHDIMYSVRSGSKKFKVTDLGLIVAKKRKYGKTWLTKRVNRSWQHIGKLCYVLRAAMDTPEHQEVRRAKAYVTWSDARRNHYSGMTRGQILVLLGAEVSMAIYVARVISLQGDD
ncbi:hypothetical protein HAX54_048599, partial [Datura stramonium]|nr:hypothetical protein [Datura stramonium]